MPILENNFVTNKTIPKLDGVLSPNISYECFIYVQARSSLGSNLPQNPRP